GGCQEAEQGRGAARAHGATSAPGNGGEKESIPRAGAAWRVGASLEKLLIRSTAMSFWKKPNQVNETQIAKLLASDAAKALLADQQRQEDEAALSRRIPVLDALAQAESKLHEVAAGTED